MTTTLSSQALQNLKAQVGFWDAKIQTYETQAHSETDIFTQQALFDEIVHLKAKRDQFVSVYNLDDGSDDEDLDTDTNEDEHEPSEDDLEEIETEDDEETNDEDEDVENDDDELKPLLDDEEADDQLVDE